MLTQSTTLMSPTTCRRAHARGRFLVGAALLTSVSNSIAGSDLPLSLGRRGASLWGGGGPSKAQLSILMSATICRRLPALLTSVSNSIAGSVLPPRRSRGGVSLCEGATHLWTTCFFPLSGVHSLTLQR